MQIRKKWLNQLKNFFNKHFKEYYLASFCWWIPSSCENHGTLAPNGTRLSACHFTGPKKLDFQGPTPSHLPKCPHQKHYARGRINHRCINSYLYLFPSNPGWFDFGMCTRCRAEIFGGEIGQLFNSGVQVAPEISIFWKCLWLFLGV